MIRDVQVGLSVERRDMKAVIEICGFEHLLVVIFIVYISLVAKVQLYAEL